MATGVNRAPFDASGDCSAIGCEAAACRCADWAGETFDMAVTSGDWLGVLPEDGERKKVLRSMGGGSD